MIKPILIILAIVLVPALAVTGVAWVFVRSAANTADEWNKIATPLTAGFGTSALISAFVSMWSTRRQIEANTELENVKQRGAQDLQMTAQQATAELEQKKTEAMRAIEALKLILPAQRDAYKKLAANAMRYSRVLKQLERGQWNSADAITVQNEIAACEDEAIFIDPADLDRWYLFRQMAFNTAAEANKAGTDEAALKQIWHKHQRELVRSWDKFLEAARKELIAR